MRRGRIERPEEFRHRGIHPLHSSGPGVDPHRRRPIAIGELPQQDRVSEGEHRGQRIVDRRNPSFEEFPVADLAHREQAVGCEQHAIARRRDLVREGNQTARERNTRRRPRAKPRRRIQSREPRPAIVDRIEGLVGGPDAALLEHGTSRIEPSAAKARRHRRIEQAAAIDTALAHAFEQRRHRLAAFPRSVELRRGIEPRCGRGLGERELPRNREQRLGRRAFSPRSLEADRRERLRWRQHVGARDLGEPPHAFARRRRGKHLGSIESERLLDERRIGEDRLPRLHRLAETPVGGMPVAAGERLADPLRRRERGRREQVPRPRHARIRRRKRRVDREQLREQPLALLDDRRPLDGAERVLGGRERGLDVAGGELELDRRERPLGILRVASPPLREPRPRPIGRHDRAKRVLRGEQQLPVVMKQVRRLLDLDPADRSAVGEIERQHVAAARHEQQIARDLRPSANAHPIDETGPIGQERGVGLGEAPTRRRQVAWIERRDVRTHRDQHVAAFAIATREQIARLPDRAVLEAAPLELAAARGIEPQDRRLIGRDREDRSADRDRQLHLPRLDGEPRVAQRHRHAPQPRDLAVGDLDRGHHAHRRGHERASAFDERNRERAHPAEPDAAARAEPCEPAQRAVLEGEAREVVDALETVRHPPREHQHRIARDRRRPVGKEIGPLADRFGRFIGKPRAPTDRAILGIERDDPSGAGAHGADRMAGDGHRDPVGDRDKRGIADGAEVVDLSVLERDAPSLAPAQPIERADHMPFVQVHGVGIGRGHGDEQVAVLGDPRRRARNQPPGLLQFTERAAEGRVGQFDRPDAAPRRRRRIAGGACAERIGGGSRRRRRLEAVRGSVAFDPAGERLDRLGAATRVAREIGMLGDAFEPPQRLRSEPSLDIELRKPQRRLEARGREERFAMEPFEIARREPFVRIGFGEFAIASEEVRRGDQRRLDRAADRPERALAALGIRHEPIAELREQPSGDPRRLADVRRPLLEHALGELRGRRRLVDHDRDRVLRRGAGSAPPRIAAASMTPAAGPISIDRSGPRRLRAARRPDIAWLIGRFAARLA